MRAPGASTETSRRLWLSSTKPTQDTPESLNSRRAPRMGWILCYNEGTSYTWVLGDT